MPIKYIVLVVGGNERDNTPMKVLINKITEQEKLQEVKMWATEIIGIQQWNKTLWNQQKNLEKQFSFGDYVMWFSKGNKSHLGKFTRNGLDLTKYSMCCQITLCNWWPLRSLKLTPVLVNVSKLKPYKYMESKVQKQE